MKKNDIKSKRKAKWKATPISQDEYDSIKRHVEPDLTICANLKYIEHLNLLYNNESKFCGQSVAVSKEYEKCPESEGFPEEKVVGLLCKKRAC